MEQIEVLAIELTQDLENVAFREIFILTKRNIFQILGQFYSQNLNLFHFFPQTILKYCCAKHTKENNQHEDWEGYVDQSLHVGVLAAVYMYFEETKIKQLRNTLHHSLDCTILLLCQSDAGGLLHATAFFLVQVMRVGDKTSNTVNFLCCFPFTNQSKVLSLPYLELVALSKQIDTGARLSQSLHEMGLSVHPKNIFFCCDNKTSIQWATTPPSLLEKKVSHVVSKICLTMMALDKTPAEILFHDQSK